MLIVHHPQDVFSQHGPDLLFAPSEILEQLRDRRERRNIFQSPHRRHRAVVVAPEREVARADELAHVLEVGREPLDAAALPAEIAPGVDDSDDAVPFRHRRICSSSVLRQKGLAPEIPVWLTIAGFVERRATSRKAPRATARDRPSSRRGSSSPRPRGRIP